MKRTALNIVTLSITLLMKRGSWETQLIEGGITAMSAVLVEVQGNPILVFHAILTCAQIALLPMRFKSRRRKWKQKWKRSPTMNI